MSKTIAYVLDSFAVLSYFQKEPGFSDIIKLLEDASGQKVILYMSLINAGEVFYQTCRHRGLRQAKEIINDIKKLPINLCEVDEERILAAAAIKARHKISYADAFVASLANEYAATIVTGDPEFTNLEKDIRIHWLPNN